MKKFIVCTVASLGLVSIVMAEGTNVLSDPKSRVSYAVGMMTGHQWKQQEVDFDPDIYARGIKDALSGGVMLLTPEQAQQTIASFKQEFSAKQQTRNAQLAVKNKAAGDAFLAANKNQPGVETLPDGLQYLVLTKGTGATPTPSDTVTVNYRGTLIDGTEFDSSYKRNEPIEFPLNQVIRGWTEGVQLMKEGAKYQFYIPSKLAYGSRGAGGAIGPDETLIFDVELLKVR